jgi:hypothetical protein
MHLRFVMGKVSSEGPRCYFHWGQKLRKCILHKSRLWSSPPIGSSEPQKSQKYPKTGASGSSAVKLWPQEILYMGTQKSWPQEILYMGPRKKQTQIARRRIPGDSTQEPETPPSGNYRELHYPLQAQANLTPSSNPPFRRPPFLISRSQQAQK